MVRLVTKESKSITLKQLLENSPEEIKVKDKVVKVRLPTNKERLEVKEELSKLPGYSLMTDVEKRSEETRLLALKMLVDPVVTVKDYLNAPDADLSITLDTAALWYATKLKKLNDDRKPLIDHFLKLMKEK